MTEDTTQRRAALPTRLARNSNIGWMFIDEGSFQFEDNQAIIPFEMGTVLEGVLDPEITFQRGNIGDVLVRYPNSSYGIIPKKQASFLDNRYKG